MAGADFNPGEDRFTRNLIRRKARQLVGRVGFQQQDREDIERELIVRILRKLRSYDTSKGHLYPYLTAVAERCIANLIRDKRTGKRDDRRNISLSLLISLGDEDSTELGATISDSERDARLGCKRRTNHELVDLAIDVADLLARLSEADRTLLQGLTERSLKSLAGEMGIPRTTLAHRLRRPARTF